LLLLLQWLITVAPSGTTNARYHGGLIDSLDASRHHAPRKMKTSSFHPNSKEEVTLSRRNTRAGHAASKSDDLQSYSYANNPIVPSSVYTPHSSNPLPVFLLGSGKTQGAGTGILLDGLARSRYVKLIQNKEEWFALKDDPKQIVVHMVDWDHLQRDCHYLEQMYGGLPQPASHMLVYFDLSASTRVTSCHKVNALFQNRYRVIKQSIVEGRCWSPKNEWVSHGNIVDNTIEGDGPILHSPHFLRERFVDLMLEALRAAKEDLSQIVSRHRRLDVVHVWRKGDASHYGRLRRQVSSVIQDLNGTKVDGHSLRWLVRPRGDDDGIEKGTIQPEYVASLISCKIVVVAQRDEWEDHFRLMESLASGAMVMTDVMLATPHGLKNGTNIITYDDAESLRRLILYYTQHKEERITIAKRGWELSMGRHRSWHRMEQLLFGAARSKVDKPLESRPDRVA